MQNSLGPACIFLRKNIADKQRQRELSGDEIEELCEAFQEFDKDKDGYISCKDLGNLMRTMGYMPTEMELIELSQQINMNLGGHVAFDDFVELMAPKLLAETAGMIGLQEMRDVFKEVKTDGRTQELDPERKDGLDPLKSALVDGMWKIVKGGNIDQGFDPQNGVIEAALGTGNYFDTNGDGKITLTELRQTMQRLMSETMTPQEINDMVKDADVNGDGTVDFEEFVWMMSR